MNLATNELNKGISDSSLRYLLEKDMRAGKLKAKIPTFRWDGKFVGFESINRLPESREAVVTDVQSGNNYVVYSNSYGGAFSEDGDQTQYSHFELTKLSPGFEPKFIGHGIRLNIPKDRRLTELVVDHSTDWDGSGEIDRVSGENGKTILAGESDRLIQDIVDYINSY